MGTVCRARRRNELIEPGGSDARFPACVDSGGIVRLGIASTRTGWARGHAKARKYGCDCDASSDVGLGLADGNTGCVRYAPGRPSLRSSREDRVEDPTYEARQASPNGTPTVGSGARPPTSSRRPPSPRGASVGGARKADCSAAAPIASATTRPRSAGRACPRSRRSPRASLTPAPSGRMTPSPVGAPTASVSRTPLRAPSRRSARAPSTPAPSGRMTPSPAGEITGTPRHLGVNREHSEPDAVQAVPAPGRRSLSDSGAEARVKRPHVLQACTFPRATPTAPAA